MKSFIATTITGEANTTRLYQAVTTLRDVIVAGRSDGFSDSSAVSTLYDISAKQIGAYKQKHDSTFFVLRRPSRITLIWPKLAILPPATIILFRMLYSSRESIVTTAVDLVETIHGFWSGYVIDPIRGILNTIRTGGDEATVGEPLSQIAKEKRTISLDFHTLNHK